jgi:hypothetical protein
MVTATMKAIPTINTGPSAAIIATLTDAPSKTIANSRTNFALKLIPGVQRGPGSQNRPHGHAEKDRENEGFEVGLTREGNFDHLQQGCGAGDRNAKNDAWQKKF